MNNLTGSSTESEKGKLNSHLSPAESGKPGFNNKISESMSDQELEKQWVQRKMKVASELEMKIRDMRANGASPDEIQSEISDVIARNLKIENNDATHFSQELMNQVPEPAPVKMSDSLLESENEALKSRLEEKDSLVVRMKRLIDGMKDEIVSMKEAQAATKAAMREENGEAATNERLVTKIEQELQRAKRILLRERECWSLKKKSLQKAIEVKDKQVNMFKEKTEKFIETQKERSLDEKGKKDLLAAKMRSTT